MFRQNLKLKSGSRPHQEKWGHATNPTFPSPMPRTGIIWQGVCAHDEEQVVVK